MSDVSPTTAEHAVRQMMSAQGRRADAEVVTELARVITEAKCATCALRVFEAWRIEKSAKNRLPTGPELRAEIREMGSSAEHGLHVGQDARAVSTSELETFWRQDAARIIRPHANNDRDLALFIAAQMWWSELAPTIESVTAEMGDEKVKRTWIQSAFVYCQSQTKTSMAEHVERAFFRARKASTYGIESITDEELVV